MKIYLNQIPTHNFSINSEFNTYQIYVHNCQFLTQDDKFKFSRDE